MSGETPDARLLPLFRGDTFNHFLDGFAAFGLQGRVFLMIDSLSERACQDLHGNILLRDTSRTKDDPVNLEDSL